jgi:hypothetical protein
MARSRLVSVLALFVGFTISGRACADAGFGSTTIDLTLTFQNLADYPDYDFYLKYGRSNGNPRSKFFLTKVEPNSPTRLAGEGRHRTDIYLLAMPRGQRISVPENGQADWLSAVPSNGLQSTPLKGSPAGDALGNDSAATYQVKINASQLEVKCTEAKSTASHEGAWILAVLGVICAAVPIAAGVVVVLLIVRSKRKRTAGVAS